jgi:hypothetical protein
LGARVRVKLLLDENLSVSVAKILCTEDGHDACHVRDRAMLGVKDRDVLKRAFEEDRILARPATVPDGRKRVRARDRRRSRLARC